MKLEHVKKSTKCFEMGHVCTQSSDTHTHFAFARLYRTVSDKVVLRQWEKKSKSIAVCR